MFPNRMLVCVENPEALEKCQAEIGWLARRLGCSLVVYHALRPYSLELESYREEKWAGWERIRELTAAPEFEGVDVTAAHEEDPSDIVEAILKASADEGADLVVVPTHGRGALERLVVGSVAEGVVRSCRIPVLTFDLDRVDVTSTRVAFDRVLAPVDFSETSLGALRHAADLASRIGCHMTALNVVEVGDVVSGLGRFANDDEGIRDLLIPDFEKELESAVVPLREAVDVDIESLTVIGTIVDRVRAWVEDHEHPLVVMATAGRDSLGDHIIGSRTERIIRSAGCSVLSLPATFARRGIASVARD